MFKKINNIFYFTNFLFKYISNIKKFLIQILVNIDIKKKINNFFLLKFSNKKFNLLKSSCKKNKIKKCSKFYTKKAEGIINIKSSGYGFVKIQELKQDIFIPKNKTFIAFEGDKVEIQFTKIFSKKRIKGKVVKIIERKKIFFVGILKIISQKKYGFVIIQGKSLHVDFYIPKEKIKGAKNNQKVVIRFLNWPKNSINPIGEIVNILGTSGYHDTEIHAILAEYNLPHSFPKNIEKQAKKIFLSNITKNEIVSRRDMRKITTFTIDPDDAKDFDDALSIRLLKNNHWEIGVHISDVSHYIKENSLFDKEAYQRGTSVYLVDRVIPMLPELISNKLCSLLPMEEKLCFSVIFEIDKNGNHIKSWFGKTIICSNRRFTYEEAQERILSSQGDFCKEIIQLNNLAKILRKKRLKKSVFSFNKNEIKFCLNKKNEPIDFFWKKNQQAHRLIEEFMILANSKVAEFVSLNSKGENSKLTYIYRVHDNPDMEKLLILKNFVKPLGYILDLRNRKTINNTMNNLLISVRGKPEQNIIDSLAIRSMSKAKYSTKNIGHYALSFDYYTHFTSPIRRYPDIIAHRLLNHYLSKGKNLPSNIYEEKCIHACYRERLASDAERDSIKYMQIKYIDRFIGKIFEGIISSITEWGIYIELSIAGAEGLIRFRDMIKDDIYIFKSKKYCIKGKKTKKVYRIGDSIKVKILNTDIDKKQINLQWLYIKD